MSKLQEAEKIISVAKQLLEVVKDETIAEPDADRLVGQLLLKLDIAIQQYEHPAVSNMRDRLEIVKPIRKKSTKRSSK